MSPEWIGPYRIVRELGSGGMGTVYEAIRPPLSRSVAIKVLHREHSLDSELAKRFFNEARAACLVEHPGIVQVFEFGQAEQGRTYLVMELLRGESLAQRLLQADRFSDMDRLRIARQVADVLSAVHAAGIVHRDLKPENVMLVRDPAVPGGERVKLVDFGIAKVVAFSGEKTNSALLMGTPLYMSPEQCRGAGKVDAKTDVYSLGIMLYEMLAWRLPFEAEGPGDLIGMHLHVKPQPLARFRSDLPLEVTRFVDSLLQKDRLLRPTMTQVVRELDICISRMESLPRDQKPPLEDEVDALGPTYPRPLRVPDGGQPEPAPEPAPQPARRAHRARPLQPREAAPDEGPAEQAGSRPSVRARARRSNSQREMFFWISATVMTTAGLYLILTDERCLNAPGPPYGLNDSSRSGASGGSNTRRELTSIPPQAAEDPSSIVRDYSAPVEYDLSKLRVKGATPKLPRGLVEQLPCTVFRAVYELCINEQGGVDSVEPVTSAPGADKEFIRTLLTWKFPTGRAKICSRIGFQLSTKQDGQYCKEEEAEAPALIPLDWLADNTRGSIYPLPTWPLKRPLQPCERRSLSYKICIARSGSVEYVNPVNGLETGDFLIIKTLKRWRYRQLAFPVCVVQPISFSGPGDAASCTTASQQAQ